MPYAFCPDCGGRLEDRVLDDHPRRVCRECGFILYENSKPCVGVLVVRDGKLLLVERAIEPFKGYWDVPGGFLEPGEHPEAGSIRELREETGLTVRPTELLGVWMDVYGERQEPTLNLCYLAEAVGGEAVAGSDASALHWFPLTDLPEQIAFAWEAEAIAVLKSRLT